MPVEAAVVDMAACDNQHLGELVPAPPRSGQPMRTPAPTSISPLAWRVDHPMALPSRTATTSPPPIRAQTTPTWARRASGSAPLAMLPQGSVVSVEPKGTSGHAPPARSAAFFRREAVMGFGHAALAGRPQNPPSRGDLPAHRLRFWHPASSGSRSTPADGQSPFCRSLVQVLLGS
jgi:hypothetical protein